MLPTHACGAHTMLGSVVLLYVYCLYCSPVTVHKYCRTCKIGLAKQDNLHELCQPVTALIFKRPPHLTLINCHMLTTALLPCRMGPGKKTYMYDTRQATNTYKEHNLNTQRCYKSPLNYLTRMLNENDKS